MTTVSGSRPWIFRFMAFLSAYRTGGRASIPSVRTIQNADTTGSACEEPEPSSRSVRVRSYGVFGLADEPKEAPTMSAQDEFFGDDLGRKIQVLSGALIGLIDQVNQLSGDNRVLSEALRDIEKIAGDLYVSDAIGCGADAASILHIARLPAVKAAMNL